MTAIRRRLPVREIEFVTNAAYGLADPGQLIQACQDRANRLSGEYVTDPLTVRIDQDRIQETIEEIVDAVNNNVWWLEDNLDHPAAPLMFQALQNLVHTHSLLQQARIHT